ncbi:DUF4177 domain-containing protein [Citreimonas sp.]|uniref:DUF4177 domain-containing protein n=1 Tax=Citreimonas sp. TaxID=3036715 RepID=UPI004058C43C
MTYEYKVVPAPERGEKVRGLKTPEARFAAAVERTINEMAAQGWEYQRTDTLPSEERSGLTQTQTVWRHLLVFRRGTAAAQAATPAAQPAARPALAPAPAARPATPEPAVAQAPEEATAETHEADEDADTRPESRPLTATRGEPRRKLRIAPPREDPAIAAPVRKLFAGPPRVHAVETHPNDPSLRGEGSLRATRRTDEDR